MATKICPNCDATIGETETKCPACAVELEELENEIGAVSRALGILEKRKKSSAGPGPTPTPTPTPAPTPTPEPKAKKSIFSNLAGRK